LIGGPGYHYSHKLAEGENPKTIAGRLTRELRSALRGKDAPVQGLDGPIHYPKVGLKLAAAWMRYHGATMAASSGLRCRRGFKLCAVFVLDLDETDLRS
jgi:hypothetical protein